MPDEQQLPANTIVSTLNFTATIAGPANAGVLVTYVSSALVLGLGAQGTLLGLYWMLFGIGAVLGGLAVGALKRLPLWPVTIGIVIAWGVVLLPFGLDVPVALTIVCFTLGGAIYGPFVALSVTLMQQKAPPRHLASMLAARSAVLLTAAPLGTALGGPLATALGPSHTLSGSGLATVALGAIACLLLLSRR